MMPLPNTKPKVPAGQAPVDLNTPTLNAGMGGPDYPFVSPAQPTTSPIDPYWGAGGGGGSTPSPIQGLSTLTHVPPVGPIDTGASHAAAFGRAKDEAGMTAQAALMGLHNALGSRGMGGGGYEGSQTGHILTQGANTMGEAGRAEAQSEADRAQHTAEFNANLGMGQRGQDIGQNEADYQGRIQQRGQDIGAQQQAAQLELQRQINKQRILQDALRGLSRSF